MGNCGGSAPVASRCRPAGLASLGYYPVRYLRFGVGLAASGTGPERNGRLS
jgi:hypothetical protein